MYTIEFTPSALRDLNSVPKTIQKRIDNKILSLIDNARPPNSKKLKGSDVLYRIRVGKFRIIYEIQNKKLIILIIRIRFRDKVYKM